MKELMAERDSMGVMRSIVVVVAVIVAMLSSSKAEAQEAHNDYTYYPIEGANHKAPRIRTEFGVGIGGAYTGMTNISTTDVKLKPRFGFQGHIDLAVCFGRNFAIETEVAYEGGSIDAATESVEHRVKVRTVDIPILLSLRMLGSRIRISAGPMFTVMSRAEYTHEGEVMFYGPVQPTWNIAGGVAVGLGRHFIIEARYIHALVETTNQFQGVEFSTRPYKVTAGVTLLF